MHYLRRYDPHKCGTVSKILNLNGYASISTIEAANIQWTIPPALKIAIYEADTIIYTLPGPSDNLRRFLSDDPGLLAGKTVIEANYKSPVLSFTSPASNGSASRPSPRTASLSAGEAE